MATGSPSGRRIRVYESPSFDQALAVHSDVTGGIRPTPHQQRATSWSSTSLLRTNANRSARSSSSSSMWSSASSSESFFRERCAKATHALCSLQAVATVQFGVNSENPENMGDSARKFLRGQKVRNVHHCQHSVDNSVSPCTSERINARRRRNRRKPSRLYICSAGIFASSTASVIVRSVRPATHEKP